MGNMVSASTPSTNTKDDTMPLSARERLKQFYACFQSEDHVLVAINADPDAIACAWAVKRLLWRKTANVTISNVNLIDRPDNLTLIRLIGIAITPFKKIDPKRYNRVVMVDSQPDHHETLASLKPCVIIDHHPVGPTYLSRPAIVISGLNTGPLPAFWWSICGRPESNPR